MAMLISTLRSWLWKDHDVDYIPWLKHMYMYMCRCVSICTCIVGTCKYMTSSCVQRCTYILKKAGLDVIQSHPLCGMHFGASLTVPGWLGEGDCYLMQERQSNA